MVCLTLLNSHQGPCIEKEKNFLTLNPIFSSFPMEENRQIFTECFFFFFFWEFITFAAVVCDVMKNVKSIVTYLVEGINGTTRTSEVCHIIGISDLETDRDISQTPF